MFMFKWKTSRNMKPHPQKSNVRTFQYKQTRSSNASRDSGQVYQLSSVLTGSKHSFQGNALRCSTFWKPQGCVEFCLRELGKCIPLSVLQHCYNSYLKFTWIRKILKVPFARMLRLNIHAFSSTEDIQLVTKNSSLNLCISFTRIWLLTVFISSHFKRHI